MRGNVCMRVSSKLFYLTKDVTLLGMVYEPKLAPQSGKQNKDEVVLRPPYTTVICLRQTMITLSTS